MFDEVMSRLLSIQPLPRGDRLARYDLSCGPPVREPLWHILAWQSDLVSGCIGVASHVRRAAWPLRRAREQRWVLRVLLKRYGSHKSECSSVCSTVCDCGWDRVRP